MDRTQLQLDRPPVRKDLFVTVIGPTVSVRLVEYTDGRFGILHNVHPLQSRIWEDEELEGCIDTYLKLCRSMATEPTS